MAESREEAAIKAGWRPHPHLTRAAQASRWAKPQLSLRVYAIHDLVTLIAFVEWVGDDGKLVHHGIAQATWKAPEVSERAVVDWGHRALGKWLSEQMDGVGE